MSTDHHTLLLRDGILRDEHLLTTAQTQTSEVFSYKWEKRDTFESQASLQRMREWLIERYGDVESASWWSDYGSHPVVLDAGCGAAMSAIELFGERLQHVRYLGVDVSEAVDVAAARLSEREADVGFIQGDVSALPLANDSVDVVFSEGVMHHTDDTKRAFLELMRVLKPGGRFLFYVYRVKGPLREFTDDYVRQRLADLPPEDAWNLLMPLTQLGKALGDLDQVVHIPEAVELLGIPAGDVTIQRLFYWYVAKTFHHPELSLEELNHINYDWYAPRNARRHTQEEVQAWCAEAGLHVEREVCELAGITVVGRKKSG